MTLDDDCGPEIEDLYSPERLRLMTHKFALERPDFDEFSTRIIAMIQLVEAQAKSAMTLAEIDRNDREHWARDQKRIEALTTERDEYHQMLHSILALCDDSTRASIGPDAPLRAVRKVVEERDVLRARLVGAEFANAAATAILVEHSELNGHVEVTEQCRDWIEQEHIMEGGDTSGRLRDFTHSLRVVIDQLDRQRRSRNWFEAAYTAGKQKLIESALSKVCCKGEPHTCDQEAVAAAEGRTDRVIIERDLAIADAAKMRAVVEAAKEWRESLVPTNVAHGHYPVRDLVLVRAIDNAISTAKGGEE